MLGLSWWRDVGDLLDEDGNLQGSALIKFRDLVKQRDPIKITKGWLQEQRAVCDDDKNPPESWQQYFAEKKERLLAFLDEAITAGDPISCSI